MMPPGVVGLMQPRTLEGSWRRRVPWLRQSFPLSTGPEGVWTWADMGSSSGDVSTSSNGTGAQPTQLPASTSTDGEVGVASCSTGTTTTGRCAFVSPWGPLMPEAGPWCVSARVSVSAAWDALQTYAVWVGANGALSQTVPTNGAGWRYDGSLSPNWVAVVRVAGVDAWTWDSGVAPAVRLGGSMTCLVVERIVGDGVRFAVGATLATMAERVSPSVPVGVMMAVAGLAKTGTGATARLCYLDWLHFAFVRTSSR